jgi:hypothetical protein
MFIAMYSVVALTNATFKISQPQALRLNHLGREVSVCSQRKSHRCGSVYANQVFQLSAEGPAVRTAEQEAVILAAPAPGHGRAVAGVGLAGQGWALGHG